MLQLADIGYDVWMGNSRGTEFSQGHQTLSATRHEKYWDFTYDDMGTYDIPAMFNEIKTQTGEDKIFYIGYSQGAAQMFTALADKNMGIKDSIHKFISLSPCVQFKTNFKDEPITETYFEEGLYKFNENGIRSYKGPNWNIELARICGQFDE